MTKKIIKILAVISTLIIIFCIYLVVFGLETTRFNSLINKEVINQNNRLSIDLKKIKLHLNLKNFSLKIKTNDPILIIDKDKKILLKEISSNIKITSYFQNKFLLSKITIITSDNEIKKYLDLYSLFERTPQVILLNQFVKKGNLKFKVNINFNKNGKIKDNYQIEGEAKNIDFNILKFQKIKNLNFNFDIKKNIYNFKEIFLNFEGVKFNSDNISVSKEKKNFMVKGSLNNKTHKINHKFAKLIEDLNFEKFDLIDKNFNSNTNFTFIINEKFKISNFNYTSEVNINELILNYENKLIKNFFIDYDKSIKFKNNKFIISNLDDKLNVKGKGEYLIKDNNIDFFNFEIVKKKDRYNYNISIDLTNQKLQIEDLEYIKDSKIKSSLELIGRLKENQIELESVIFKEKKNFINLKNLDIKNNKILNIDNIDIDLSANNKFRNQFVLKRKNKNFFLDAKSLNFEVFINKMSKNDKSRSLFNIFDDLNSKIEINIAKANLDSESEIKNIRGFVEIKKNKIFNVNLNSSFSDKEKIFLKVKTNSDNSVITNFSSDRAKPFVKKYKFIKGFDGGNIDFSSSRIGSITKSKLIIDNFKVQEVPILAKILTLASLQGIADLLTGEGIRFTDFEMIYSKKGKVTTIDEIYSIGPAISIMMDGYIEEEKLVSLRGTLVPATTINRTISSIPLIGDILVGKKVGEGVFGVSFKIKGHPKNLKTTVNPIKTLTPRFITRTLENIKKN